jgi:hypothetical protein
MEGDKGVRGRVTKQGEEAIGKLAQGVLEHPVVTGAVSAAFDARARAIRAQEAAMGALNLPSATDVERLTRRLRSVSQRLEAIEEGIDRVQERVRSAMTTPVERRLDAIEAALARIEVALGTRPADSAPESPPPPAEKASGSGGTTHGGRRSSSGRAHAAPAAEPPPAEPTDEPQSGT